MAKGRTETIIQALIDRPELDRYFHADTLPERKPLAIKVDGGAGKLAGLRKFGLPVTILKALEPGRPVLAIKLSKPVAGEIRLTFAYEVEGIVGEARAAAAGNTFVLRGVSVSER